MLKTGKTCYITISSIVARLDLCLKRCVSAIYQYTAFNGSLKFRLSEIATSRPV